MNISFWGGAGTVTGSKYLESRLHWDCAIPKMGEKVDLL